MSIFLYAERDPVLPSRASRPLSKGDAEELALALQGARRPRAAPGAELHRRAARRRGVRLPRDRAGRAFAADREPPPEAPSRRGASRAREARARGSSTASCPSGSKPSARRSRRARPRAEQQSAHERRRRHRLSRRRVVAEGVGTALLLATVVGSGIMGERLAGGNVGARAAREHARDRRGAGRSHPHVRPDLGRAFQPGRDARRRLSAASRGATCRATSRRRSRARSLGVAIART